MGVYTDHSDLYSRLPLTSGSNRDENIILDVLGTWIPECELIYYGLLGSKYSESLYKLKEAKKIIPRNVYLDTCFFSGDDIIKYLASETDDYNTELSEEFLQSATIEALSKYLYVPCSETMMRHALIELAYFDFLKSITLVYPWKLRPIDYGYLKSIIPASIRNKFIITSGNILEYIKSKKEMKYTTVITNTLYNVNTLIDNNEEYGTKESLFLLRNSSENTEAKIFTDKDGKKQVEFTELGNEIIIPKVMDIKRGIPLNQMRFGRFEPHLFDDRKPNEKEFSYGV